MPLFSNSSFPFSTSISSISKEENGGTNLNRGKDRKQITVQRTLMKRSSLWELPGVNFLLSLPNTPFLFQDKEGILGLLAKTFKLSATRDWGILLWIWQTITHCWSLAYCSSSFAFYHFRIESELPFRSLRWGSERNGKRELERGFGWRSQICPDTTIKRR